MVSQHKEAPLVGINEKRVAQIFLHFVAEKFLFFIRDLCLKCADAQNHTRTRKKFVPKWELSS